MNINIKSGILTLLILGALYGISYGIEYFRTHTTIETHLLTMKAILGSIVVLFIFFIVKSVFKEADNEL